ncbi:MAG TPA: heme ABC exporter ATP-binding protein CcmA [Xanthobacteraceae bacterium]|jgi:heme exporter protein A|nr:heme ABC exporter ATP-binding protein CcmA [Xanthobacteraceae bacterium]
MRLSAFEIGCVRGNRYIFQKLSFAVGAGQCLLVHGPNGAGKSTLLRVIAGLLPISSGRLNLEGGDTDQTLGEQAHYFGHQDALKSSLSVRENLSFWALYFGGVAEAVEKALESVGLAPLSNLPAAHLSAGQRRRLSLARLLVSERPIWLLDEPTAALDTAAQDRLTELMRAHLGRGGIIVAATHGPIGLSDAQAIRLGAR